MRRLSELFSSELRDALTNSGLCLAAGPFLFRLSSPHASIESGLRLLYADYVVQPSSSFCDFSVLIASGRGLRRVVRPQARFIFDGVPVFEPLPAAHAYPLLEWAMNWCISNHAHRYLILHAAVLARGSHALLMPAPPGSGKSTLCAGLMWSGWRLLSDELALIDMLDGRVWPLCRPVSLKNASIQVIREFAQRAVFNDLTLDTAKGTVTHMRVSAEHLSDAQVPAEVRWIVFPKFSAGRAAVFSPHSRSDAVLALSRNSFNIALHGKRGFERLCDIVQRSDCRDFVYGDLHKAAAVFETLASNV